MSIQRSASPRRGPLTAPFTRSTGRRTMISIGAALTATLPCAAHAAEDQAQTVLNRVRAVYTQVQSYQANATIIQTLSLPKGSTVVTMSEGVAYKGPNLFRVQAKVRATGAGAGAANSGENLMVSNGKVVYMYDPEHKQYMKKPIPPSVPLLILFQPLTMIPRPEAVGATMLPPTTYQGRAVYVIEVPPLPPNATDAQKKQLAAAGIKPEQLFVDKQTYHLLGVKQTAPNNTMDIQITSQTVNGAVAQSGFDFTPPSGAKEVTPRPTPAPQGAPKKP